MTGHQAAYGRAHAAVTRIVADDDGQVASHVLADEVLGTLTRLGWRWVPQVAREPEDRQPAPPPADWAEHRRHALEVAERRTETVREAEK